MVRILWGVIVVLFVLWIIGFAFKIAGNLIHIVLVVALIVLVYNLVMGSRSRRTLLLLYVIRKHGSECICLNHVFIYVLMCCFTLITREDVLHHYRQQFCMAGSCV